MRSHKSPITRLGRSGVWLVLLACLIALAGLKAFPLRQTLAEPGGPRVKDRHVAKVVVALLSQDHLSKHELDDEISHRCLKSFLRALDPLKLYFYQSDIAEFSASRDDLDDQIKEGDIAFAHQVFERFLQRMDERIQVAGELLEEKHDFSVDEYFVTDPDMARYAANAEEARERWRKRIKYDFLAVEASTDKDKEYDPEKARQRLSRRYTSFDKRMHQTNGDDLLEMYLTSMTTGYDPHTTYMSPSTLENFYIQMKLNLEGIGAALMFEDGYTKVTKIIQGGAADKDGRLKVADRIVSVGEGADGEMDDVVDMRLSDVVKLIRGKAGTIVRLGVTPENKNETKIYDIMRAKIELKDSEARSVTFDAGKKPGGAPYKIGVIDLPSFYMDMEAARQRQVDFKSTTRDVRKILEDFNEQHVDAVVLDLRLNGGGSLTEAINLTGLFIDYGPVVQVQDSEGRVQHYDDLDRGMAWEGPLVVLTSKFSASASEILAGAIQDYHRGLIVGDTSTHGKGTVQSLLNLGKQLFHSIPHPPNFGALKITMQQFFRPNGDSTQQRGVLADIVLPAITSHMDVGENSLDYSLEFSRVPAAHYEQCGVVDEAMLKQLRTDSSGRRAKSEDFDKLRETIARYLVQKERKKVSLNEETFLADRAGLDDEEAPDHDPLEDGESDDEEVVKRTYYVDEVLDITVDYIELLKEKHLLHDNKVVTTR